MFKAIVLCAPYNLSDDQVEYQIRDRFSFMRFFGLGLGDKVPDTKTAWLYRDRLAQAGRFIPGRTRRLQLGSLAVIVTTGRSRQQGQGGKEDHGERAAKDHGQAPVEGPCPNPQGRPRSPQRSALPRPATVLAAQQA